MLGKSYLIFVKIVNEYQFSHVESSHGVSTESCNVGPDHRQHLCDEAVHKSADTSIFFHSCTLSYEKEIQISEVFFDFPTRYIT